MQQPRLEVKNFGPIKEADVTFGDLSIIVGPQATGKSIFFQLLKLLLDSQSILKELDQYGWLPQKTEVSRFLDIYFGEGMSSLHNESSTQIKWNGTQQELRKIIKNKGAQGESAFLIPAQRVLALREGQTRPFGEYRVGDPFSLCEFSQKLHTIVQFEMTNNDLFPVSNHFKKEFRKLISENIFNKFSLTRDKERAKRLVLKTEQQAGLPYFVWSAGQREFVPLLLGLDWLVPPGGVSRRDEVQWVMIEELEMGLHPSAISTVMLLVMELLDRGYRVCLTTHSPHVLDIAWALQVFKKKGGTGRDFLKIFNLDYTTQLKDFGERIFKKSISVHYFTRGGLVKDISTLNPGSDENDEAGWGGLSEFSGRIGDIVANVVTRHEFGSAAK